jgi:NAD(P)-dependent dehydrogenase (short-subunit alcohol dehydrogenase family)
VRGGSGDAQLEGCNRGGASGIGVALGERLVRLSCFVLLADLGEQDVHRAAERISRLGLLETTSEAPCRLIRRLCRRFPI